MALKKKHRAVIKVRYVLRLDDFDKKGGVFVYREEEIIVCCTGGHLNGIQR